MPTAHDHPTDAARTLDELLNLAARAFPRSQFVFPDERCTYPELDRRATAFAGMLQAAGLQPRGLVGLWVPPSIDLLAAIIGTMRAGGVAVPISDRYRPDEVRYAAEHADLQVLVTTPAGAVTDRPAELHEALPSLAEHVAGPLAVAEAPELRAVVVLGATDGRAGMTAAADLGLPPLGAEPDVPAVLPAERPDHDLAYLMYTSGTSAAPKACMISHAGSLAQGRSLAFTRYGLDAECAFWCPLPLFHNAGLATLTACIVSGATFVHSGQFEPGRTLRMLEAERVTHGIPCFETIWLRVLDHPDFATTDLSRLRVVLNTGGEDLLRKLAARLPQAVQVANYGMTEGTGHVSMTAVEEPHEIRMTTGGFPLPGMEARVVDPATREELPRGERGEIQFRGVSRFLGYYKDPAATAAVIDADGWFSSGDLGEMDPEGRLTYKGRLKDMLKVGGENVASLEVESYLLRHPAVNVVAVVGAPDAYYGEVPVAYVEMAPGAQVDEQDIIDFCVDRIATFKVPRYVRFVEEWPMSGTKIRKFVLRERIAAELAAAGITEAPRVYSSRARTLMTS